jgi:hypothetical protein
MHPFCLYLGATDSTYNHSMRFALLVSLSMPSSVVWQAPALAPRAVSERQRRRWQSLDF